MTALTEAPAYAEDVRVALLGGGRVHATVRSRTTGRHVALQLNCKARTLSPSGGFISRATRPGRVGLREADVVFVDTPLGEYVGRLDVRSGEWSFARGAERAERWSAAMLIRVALGAEVPEAADVFLALECSSCGRPLTDPESVQRMLGPECFGSRTRSRAVPRASRAQEQLS